ncbi:hypothetical protein TNCV_1139481 [Trichonephila clavipes]|nr:hypothetical protein TNCV_1139481 [Trichonephila clavipes]
MELYIERMLWKQNLNSCVRSNKIVVAVKRAFVHLQSIGKRNKLTAFKRNKKCDLDSSVVEYVSEAQHVV